MKSIWGALALSASLISPAAAQDCPGNECPMDGLKKAKAQTAAPVAPATTAVADDEEKEIRELEKELNKVLLVDETGKIVLREEVKGMLPIPAERVEAMLGTFVELGKNGKIKVKDIEMVRPYLPMIRRFLKQGGLDRLKNLPPERREAMKKMLPKAKPPTERPMRPRPQPRRARPERPARPAPRRARRRAPSAVPQQLERRLARIERSLARIEKMMNQMGRLHRDLDRREERRDRRDRRWNRRDRDEPRGRNRRRFPDLRRMFERRRGNRERGGRDMPDLRRMFERFQDEFGGRRGDRDMPDLRRMFERFQDEFGGGERDFRRMFERFRDEFAPRRERRRDRRERDDDDDDRGARRGNMLQRGNVFMRGFRRLHSLIDAKDRPLVLRALRTVAKHGKPGDMARPEKLMETFRAEMSQDDFARLMEIFSEFQATDEGRAMQRELSQMRSNMDGFMGSRKGKQFTDALKRLEQGLGGARGGLGERLERFRNRRFGDRDRAERRPERRAPRNPRAKLY